MNGDVRKLVVVGGIVLFVMGFMIGFLLGRTGDGDEGAAASPSPSPSPSVTVTQTPVITTPTPGEAPAISNEGQILLEGTRPVVPAAATTGCNTLIEPGSLGECGEVSVGGQRVVWVVQQATTATGTPAYTVRIFSFVPDEVGWVEWLQAADPTGERWAEVNVLESDLTGDGVAELLVGFRSTDEEATLEYDIVGYTQQNLPEVLAHPDPATKGVVVVSAGTIQEYGAQFPGGEPICCPPSYLRRSIAFSDGFFRVVGSETVLPTAVPLSQL
jgi:hypothetical protein